MTTNFLQKYPTFFSESTEKKLVSTPGSLLKKATALLVFILLFGLGTAMAHVTEIRVNQAQDGTLTWYLQTYHGANECGHQNAGLTINGVNYPISSEHPGSVVGLSPTVFAVVSNINQYSRSSYAIVRTPFLGTTLSVAPYSSNVCWAFLVGGSGNFTPPPPPVCTSCPLTGWSNTLNLPGNNNNTLCDLTDDYTSATITVNHLSCASITGDGKFRVVFDPAGANISYGPFNYTTGVSTNVIINIPYGTNTNTNVQVTDDDYPCSNTHGLNIPGGTYSGVQMALPTISVNGATTFCSGGSVTLTASAGSAYAWSNGESTQSIVVSQSGSYSVSVTNAGGCSVSSLPTSVNVLPTPTASVSATATICSGGNNGSVIVSATGGVSPYQYSNDGGQSFQSSGNYSSLGAGTYTSLVKGSNGCTSSSVTSVIVVDNIAPNALAKNISINLNAAGTASIVASDIDNGSNDNCGISSMTIDQSNFDCSNVGVNNVTLTVTDNNSNTSSVQATVTVNDVTAPVANAQNVTVVLGGGSASVTAADINNGSSDACGIKSMTLSNSTFNCSNIGPNAVTLTVTDNHNNSSSVQAVVTVVGVVPSCSISSAPNNSGTVIGSTNTLAAANQMFLGYGAQSMNLNCTANGGGPFTYSWTGSGLNANNITNPVFTPSAGGNYSFSCTATNSYGCQTTCTITICVLDVRASGGSASNPKVYLCHIPQGIPNNSQTLNISINAVPAHLGGHTGDRLGSCAQSCGSQKTNAAIGDIYSEGDVDLIVYPNPSSNSFRFELETGSNEEVSISIFDINGKLVSDAKFNTPQEMMVIGNELANGMYIAVVKQGDFNKTLKIQKIQ